MRLNKDKGFTLIELLVVVAIIGVLASVVLASLNSARAKARDAKVKRELAEVRSALELYLITFNTMPSPATISPETTAFNEIAQSLVTNGFLGAVPVAPSGHTYSYYNYGSGNTVGALLVSSLESAGTSTGYPGTCRPWLETDNNWCENGPNTDYCLCNPY